MTEVHEERSPPLHQVIAFLRANPLTARNLLTEQFPTLAADACSDSRLRELWRQHGGAVDGKNRAWIEIDLLPKLLREIVDACTRAASSAKPL